MKILIAYDGSKHSRAILQDLVRAGLPGEAEIIILSAADTFLPPGYELPDRRIPKFMHSRVRQTRKLVAQALDNALLQAQNAAKLLKIENPGWKIHPQSRVGSPASAILSKASEWKPDLILLGSRGKGAFSRFSFGSTAQRVLQEAKCSVRICRERTTKPGLRPTRIIIGLDGSAYSKAALKKALLRYRRSNAEIRLVAAIEPSQAAQKDRGVAKKHLEEAAKLLRREGFHVDPAAKRGYPHDVLVESARQWNADCIFLGSRGLSRARRFFLGSVSAIVAAHAPCSVEVIR